MDFETLLHQFAGCKWRPQIEAAPSKSDTEEATGHPGAPADATAPALVIPAAAVTSAAMATSAALVTPRASVTAGAMTPRQLRPLSAAAATPLAPASPAAPATTAATDTSAAPATTAATDTSAAPATTVAPATTAARTVNDAKDVEEVAHQPQQDGVVEPCTIFKALGLRKEVYRRGLRPTKKDPQANYSKAGYITLLRNYDRTNQLYSEIALGSGSQKRKLTAEQTTKTKHCMFRLITLSATP